MRPVISRRVLLFWQSLLSFSPHHLCDLFQGDLVVSRVLLSQSPAYKNTQTPSFGSLVWNHYDLNWQMDLTSWKMPNFTLGVNFVSLLFRLQTLLTSCLQFTDKHTGLFTLSHYTDRKTCAVFPQRNKIHFRSTVKMQKKGFCFLKLNPGVFCPPWLNFIQDLDWCTVSRLPVFVTMFKCCHQRNFLFPPLGADKKMCHIWLCALKRWWR